MLFQPAKAEFRLAASFDDRQHPQGVFVGGIGSRSEYDVRLGNTDKAEVKCLDKIAFRNGDVIQRYLAFRIQSDFRDFYVIRWSFVVSCNPW